MSWLIRGRDLIIGTIKHLPTIFTAGSLLIGSITGIIPILILGLVTAFLALLVFAFQKLTHSVIDKNIPLLNWFSSIGPCPDSREFLISTWASVTSFVIMYLFLNALAIYNKPPVSGASDQLVANRESYMISVMVVLCFLAIILIGYRMNFGCEGKVMGVLSIILGGGVAYGMWSLVDTRMGDIFQVINNMTSVNSSGKTTPVMCVAPQN